MTPSPDLYVDPRLTLFDGKSTVELITCERTSSQSTVLQGVGRRDYHCAREVERRHVVKVEEADMLRTSDCACDMTVEDQDTFFLRRHKAALDLLAARKFLRV